PGIFKLVGAKLNLSSGMASAAPTISLSMMPTWLSTAAPIVGGGCGVVWACGAGVGAAAGLLCAIAPTARLRTASRQNIRICFISSCLLISSSSSPATIADFGLQDRNILAHALLIHQGTGAPLIV